MAATVFTVAAAAFVYVLGFTASANAAVNPQAAAYHQNKNFYTDKCLAAAGQANGSRVQQNTCAGTSNQQWTVQPTDSGYFELVVVSSGRCMEVANSGQNSNDPVQIA